MTAVRLSDRKVLGSRSTGGAAPCHLSVHPGGRWLLSANYGSGSVAVHPDRRLGRARRAHRPGRALQPAARTRARTGRTPTRSSPARTAVTCSPSTSAPTPSTPTGWTSTAGTLTEVVAGAHPAGRGTAPPHVPPRRPVRLSRQRGRQHGRGLRLRPGHRPADPRRGRSRRARVRARTTRRSSLVTAGRLRTPISPTGATTASRATRSRRTAPG